MLYIFGAVLLLVWLVIFMPRIMAAMIKKIEQLEEESAKNRLANLPHPDMADDPYDGYHAGNFYWW